MYFEVRPVLIAFGLLQSRFDNAKWVKFKINSMYMNVNNFKLLVLHQWPGSLLEILTNKILALYITSDAWR